MKVKGFVVTRRLLYADLRNLCIRNEYYTYGTTDEYSHLFSMLNDEHGNPADMTDDLIIAIAEDIYDHSNVSRLCNCYGCNEAELLQGILHEVYDACYTLIETDIEED